MKVTLSSIVAHQGGWDEILIVVGPLLVLVGLLSWGRRRQQTPASDADRSAVERTADD